MSKELLMNTHNQKMSKQNNIFQWLLAAMLFAAIITIVAGLTSCKTCVPVVEIHDSIRTVEVHTRDTAIITKADSAQVQLLLRCDSANNVLIDQICAANGERLRMQLQLQALATGKVLLVDCKEDSLLNIIQLQDSIIKEKTNHTYVQNIEVIPPFYKRCTWALWILVVLIILGIVARVLIKVYLHK